jgi:NCS1 family nucleobase:cation symporter-1
MATKTSVATAVAREAEFGTLPVLNTERRFGFWDALLILSGYGIATWCYTQGAFQASLVNFPQLVTTAFGANIFVLAIYMLPIVFATRYGMDMWQWLKAIFGTRGIRIMVVAIILVNFPWFAVNAEIFGSTMMNLMASFGLSPDPWLAKPLALACIVIGAALALWGPVAIKWANRIMVPALILVGISVVVIGFTAIPIQDLFAYQPDTSHYRSGLEPYMASLEAGFAFGFSWCCSTAVIPRLVRKERQGYWATVGAYGVVAPFFIVAGGVLAIVSFVTLGTLDNDLATLLSQIAGPLVALVTLVLVAVANIGTHGTGTYMWSVVVKSAFPKAGYAAIVMILAAYTAVIVLWGGILDYFGAMISIAAYLYGPIMGLIFADYFGVRQRKLDLRSAYELPGSNSYHYSNGYNWIGFACLIAGFLASFAVFDAINYTARIPLFNFTTSSFLGFLVSGALYFAVSTWVPTARVYLLRDRNNITV